MKKITVLLSLLILTLSISFSQYLDPLLEKKINIGSLQSKFQAAGVERAYNGVYYEGMSWPSQYAMTDNHVIDRQWIVCRNFTDVNASHYTHLACYFSTSSVDPNYGYPMSLTQFAQFETPAVIVDDRDAGQEDFVDALNANMPYERIVINTFNSYLGVEYKRKIIAYSQQYHDNYFITEYVLKNTGNIDYDEEIELPSNNIEGLLFAIMPRYATCREAGYLTSPQMTWGKNQWISFMDIKDVETCNPDSLRCFWTWLGQGENNDIFDHIGAPDGGNGTLIGSKAGRLTAPQFAGMAVLHADRSASDNSNDYGQPSTLAWHGGDSYPSVQNKSESGSSDLYDMLTWTSLYSGNYGGHGDSIPMVGTNPLRKPYGNEKPQLIAGNEMGGPAALMTFGPYDLPNIGDSVRIVIVEAISGLDRKKCIEVGENWLADKDLILPDGSTASNRDEYKNEWVYTGRDSLFQTFKRAKTAYENNLIIPNPPQPPIGFTISSEDENILLSWTASPSESDPNFGGYRLYRSLDDPDSTFSEIYSCGEGTGNELVNEYQDNNTIKGLKYLYYITAYTDGSLNTDPAFNPIGSLESSRSYTQTTVGAMIRGTSPEGSGSVEDPYLIDEVEDIYWMMLNLDKLDKNYRQICDINFSGVDDFMPIGNSDVNFTGVYDGQAYVIDSLTYDNSSTNNVGFFGYVSYAVIRDVHLTNVNMTGYNFVGALVGTAKDSSNIFGCHVSGTISGNNYVGGIAGQNLSLSSIYDCYSEGNVTGNERVGGLVGYLGSSAVNDSYSTMSVNGNNRVGGLVGHVAAAQVYNSYCLGNVTGSTNIGGMIGFAYNAEFHSCYWDTLTSGQSVSAGGSGKSTAELKMESTFTDSGWNFVDTWLIDPTLNNGYPVLKWQLDGVGVDPVVPEAFVLRQNYPNPFNPITTIQFDVRYSDHVKLQIFDLRGRLITTLIDEFKEAGSWYVTWNANNYSSGLYIYRLEYGEYHSSRKMILMK